RSPSNPPCNRHSPRRSPVSLPSARVRDRSRILGRCVVRVRVVHWPGGGAFGWFWAFLLLGGLGVRRGPRTVGLSSCYAPTPTLPRAGGGGQRVGLGWCTLDWLAARA